MVKCYTDYQNIKLFCWQPQYLYFLSCVLQYLHVHADQLEDYKKFFSDKIATKETEDITDLKNPKYKVLIQTVNSNEFYAAMMQLEDHKATMYIGYDERFHSYSYYYVGVWDTIPVVIIQTGMGSNGVHSCWYETKKVLYFMPQLE